MKEQSWVTTPIIGYAYPSYQDDISSVRLKSNTLLLMLKARIFSTRPSHSGYINV
jgi:hypothetical protein